MSCSTKNQGGEEQRLIIVRASVHDRLMEMKKFFEKDLGEEVSFNAFLLMILQQFEAIKEAMETKAPPKRDRPLAEPLPFPEPIWVDPAPIYRWYKTETTDGTGIYTISTTGQHCTTCGHHSVTSGTCTYCGTSQ